MVIGRVPLFAIIVIEIMACLIIVNITLSQERYPHREKYPNIELISTEDLKKRYHDVMIIDVRSKMEFDVVRIKKAIHIPIGRVDFERQLGKQKSRDDERTLVFYCNGYSCEKSYKATQKAQELGLQNVLCYDSGIMDWNQAYPNLSTLMGRPLSAYNQMIPATEYQSRLAPLQEFQNKAGNLDVIVIDVRHCTG